MGRGAPNKKGLDYFPKMVDFYEDDRIFDLLDRYGPLGVTVYDCILCIVYAHGYYAEIPLDKLSKMIVKMIGNKWVKNNKAVVQVVHFCSEIGLLNDDLMTENIITSAGIQKRYYEIAVKRLRRQPHTDKYWLLGKEENGEPLLNAPLNQISSEANRINAEEIQNNSAKSTLKEKVKEKDIYMGPQGGENAFRDPGLENAFQLFVACRVKKYGPMTPEQIIALRNDLTAMATTDAERLAIVNKSVAGGWKNFYPVGKKSGKKQGTEKPANRFINFDQRSYDFEKLEKQLLGIDEKKQGEE